MSDELELQLAEATDKMAAAEERIRELEARERALKVKERIVELSEDGLKGFPGLLNTIETIMLADDGGTAILLSEDSDDGEVINGLTATDVVERILGALPRDEESKKFHLSEQHIELENDDKPPLNSDGENLTREQKAAQANAWLYDKPAR